MALFDKKDPLQEVMQLRSQGLTDDLIIQELTGKGMDPAQVQAAISQADASAPPDAAQPTEIPSSDMPAEADTGSEIPPGIDPTTFSRIEEITENMIDEKWDELISEVKKVIQWKEKVESEQKKLASDIQKLKEDFKTLHEGVLGKLDQYDNRMRDVGTELKAVGKVFKDVVPEFVENVKELKDITGNVKGKK